MKIGVFLISLAMTTLSMISMNGARASEAGLPGATPEAIEDDGILRRAVELDDVGAVRDLIQSGKATVNSSVIAVDYEDKGIPILHLAAREGSEKVAEYLVHAGADINLRSSKNETPLMLAAFFPDAIGGDITVYDKHERLARMLVEHGADLENIPNWYTPLSYSAFYGHLRIGKYLLDRGAKPDGGVTGERAQVPTALMFTSMQGYKDFTRLLLERGANPRIQSQLGHTALDLARQRKQTHLIPLLECAMELKPGETFVQHCSNVR